MERYLRTAAVVTLVLVFGSAGIFKLADPASFREQFTQFGLPGWWIPVTGAAELLGAVLIALPKLAARRFGAALLAAAMAVATVLHLLHDSVALALPALALMLVAGYVAFVAQSEPAAPGLAGA